MSDACGTYAGWNRHQKAGDTPCEPCRVAQRAYLNEYRAKNPGYVARNKARNAARQRALLRLMLEHQGRFHELYEEELTK